MVMVGRLMFPLTWQFVEYHDVSFFPLFVAIFNHPTLRHVSNSPEGRIRKWLNPSEPNVSTPHIDMNGNTHTLFNTVTLITVTGTGMQQLNSYNVSHITHTHAPH